jgi:hypothetical protein
MYSADAVIECACGGRRIIYGREGIAAYWRQRFVESPALELEDLQVDDGGRGGFLSNQQRCRSGAAEYCERWADYPLSLWTCLTSDALQQRTAISCWQSPLRRLPFDDAGSCLFRRWVSAREG